MDSLIGIYRKLKESGSPSDFPNVLANVQYKLLLKAVANFPSPWKLYTKQSNLKDFKTNDRAFLGESEDLDEITTGAPYKSTGLSDYKYQIQLGTFGKTFSLERKTVINDDLEAFKDAPNKLGRAAVRTMVKQITNLLETNTAATYDSAALFGTRNGVANQSSDALTPDSTGIASLQAGFLAMANAYDPSGKEKLGTRAKYLLVSPAKAEAANWLVKATSIGRGSTDAPNDNPLRNPALAGNIEVIVEPWLTTFPNRWYLLADPNEMPAIEVGFLNGKSDPTLMLKKAEAMIIAGGDDEFGYAYDDISYKVRHDWGVKIAMPQAIYKGGS